MITDKEIEDERIEVIRERERLHGLKQTPKHKLRKQLKDNKEILDKLLPKGIEEMEKEK